MILAEVSWEDQRGTLHEARATIQDLSRSGAYIRVKSPIAVGSRLKIKSYRDQFSGIAKNCRPDGKDFVVGLLKQSALPDGPPAATAKSVSAPAPHGDQVHSEMQRGITAPAAGSFVHSNSSHSRKPHVPLRADLHAQSFLQVRERTHMQPKWLNFASRQPQPDAPNGHANGAHAQVDLAKSEATPVKELHANASSKAPVNSPGDLLSLEDIYRAAGVMNPRFGYSIIRVIEMLNSDHIRELSNDNKRASIMMALDAAGVSPDEVLQDAKLRQQALESYESGQQKQFEDYWARKTQENSQIQAEMDRVTAQYRERINQNLQDIALEKETLHTWQTMTHQESHRISEAVGLCLKRPAPEPSSEPLPVLRSPTTSVKVV
jgi:hypothetical protein